MELTLRNYVTAGFGATVAGASLIGVVPAVSPPLDLQEFSVQLTTAAADGLTDFSAIGIDTANAAAFANPAADAGGVFTAVQAAFDLGQTQFTDGFADIAGGDLVGGLSGVVSGATNFLVSVPDTLFLGTADALLGGTLLEDGILPVLFYPPSPCDDFNDLVGDLQYQFQLAADHLFDGIQQFAAGELSEGLYNVAMSPVYLFVQIPEHLVLDSLSILFGGGVEA